MSLRRVVLAFAFVLLGTFAVPAAPAQAATITCPPMSTEVCKNIVPLAECYWKDANGTYSFVWGWNNPTSDTASIPAGSSFNNVSPADSQSQPELFPPGIAHNAFFTVSSSSSATYRLGQGTVTLDSTSAPKCAIKPVPQVGNVTAAVSLLVLLLLGALVWVAANTRPAARLRRQGLPV